MAAVLGAARLGVLSLPNGTGIVILLAALSRFRRVGKGWLARVTTIIEFCHDCGRRQPLIWHADDNVWEVITGRTDGGGVLCPQCFDRRAEAVGVMLYWVPNVEYVRP